MSCPNSVCTSNSGLAALSEENFVWRATEIDKVLPYICLSRCKNGYKWYPRLKRCLKIIDHHVKPLWEKK